MEENADGKFPKARKLPDSLKLIAGIKELPREWYGAEFELRHEQGPRKGKVAYYAYGYLLTDDEAQVIAGTDGAGIGKIKNPEGNVPDGFPYYLLVTLYHRLNGKAWKFQHAEDLLALEPGRVKPINDFEASWEKEEKPEDRRRACPNGYG